MYRQTQIKNFKTPNSQIYDFCLQKVEMGKKTRLTLNVVRLNLSQETQSALLVHLGFKILITDRSGSAAHYRETTRQNQFREINFFQRG